MLVILSCATVVGQVPLTSNQIGLLESIATQDVPENAPGIATAIIQDGKVIYERYAGLADLSDSTMIKKATRFNIASNGKQFTALAVLTLLDNKQLKLSDDIRKWFPTLYPNIKEKITVRSLLNHTSGIRDCYGLWALQAYTWWEESFNNQDVLSLIERQSSLNFKPDSQYLYSNTNYILLALLVEKVAGKSFVAYTNDLFRKLNMPNTSFESDFTNIRGSIARAYFNFGTWTTYDWIWNVVGDGNIFSSLADQIQWEKLVQGAGDTDFSMKTIRKSQQTVKKSKFKNYGYGLEFSEYKDLPYAFHEGATGAWKATTVRFPDRNISIVTLTNTGKSIPYNQTRQMADIVLGLDQAKTYFATQPTSIDEYVSEDEILGTYLTDSDFAFTFEMKGNKVFLKRAGRNDVELEREADNIFHQKYDPKFKQEFTSHSKGGMQVTAYYVDHAPYSLTKVSKIADNFNFKSLDGDFSNPETKTAISLKHLEGVIYEVIFPGDYKTTGLLVSVNKMLVDSYSFEFREADLYLNGDRIKQVKFERP